MSFPMTGVPPVISGGGENAKTTAWVNAVVAAGGSVSAGRRTTVNTLFDSLDSNSLTTKLNRLWLLAAENTQSASIDLINLQTYSLVNSPTFTTDRGYAGNGSSSYLNLNTANCGTQNSAMYGMALRTNQPAENSTSMGCDDSGTASSTINPTWGDGSMYWAINDDEGHAGVTPPASRVGIYIVTRTASTTAPCYKDGASLGTSTTTSNGTSALNFFLGCTNHSSGAHGFTVNQHSATFIGNSGFNSTEASNFNTNLQTYLTAVGA